MVAKQTGSFLYYYFKDALGSTRQVWKQEAPKAAFSVATYAPFGAPVGASGTEAFEYAGEMLVEAAGSAPGLYYVYARWMDPELGRFVSLDSLLGSLSAPQTMNRYAYCVNNPLRFVDPTGMWLESAFDLGCIVWDLVELWNDPSWENAGWLLLDVGCLIAPGVPALSPVLKTVKWADRANDARKAAGKADDLARLGGKVDDITRLGRKADVPNPHGKLGGPAHQRKVSDIISDIESRGLKWKTEFYVKGPGVKRFADVVAIDPNTGRVLEVYQVGRLTKAGNPVARELRAIADIESVLSLKVRYIPYFTL